MKNTSICCKLLLTVLLLLTLTGCSENSVEKQIFAMDTVMSLTVYGEGKEEAATAAVQEINAAARQLDPEIQDSEVYNLNHAGGESVTISPFLYNMLETAGEVYDHTGGALDLSVYPVVTVWGFIDQNYTVPDAETLTEILKLVDYSSVTYKESNGIYTATVPDGMALNFGAVAKGATADLVIETLREHGAESAFISLGGNVQTLGVKPDGTDWRVGVTDPTSSTENLGIVTVGEAAVVTSGSYQRCFEENGTLYHHIIDPSTGYPADNGLVSVTVICDTGVMADCLSTALFVLGEEKALDYWRTYGDCELILVTEDDQVVVTAGLKDRFTENSERYSYQYIE